MTKVIFASNLTQEDKDVVSNDTIKVLEVIGGLSKNPTLIINSTLRTPLRQANAMYDNEKKGNSIRYAAPGREVIAIYNANKSKSKEEVVKLMVDKIEELAKKGQLVSKHCVTKEQYKKKNIVDISQSIPNPRDFVRVAETFKNISKIITPIEAFKTNPYMTTKVFIDKNEPALHIEL